MDICIIGGGLCGLSAAYRLAEHAHIDLLEAKPALGGCLGSMPCNDTWIEQFYHHCFSGDTHLLALIRELGLEDRLEWLSGSTGYMVEGRIFPLTTLVEILKYPHLSLSDKIRLAWLTLRSRNMDAGSLDDITAKEFILSTCGEHAYASFFAPLLRSKFGILAEQVSAAWLISRIAIRSDRRSGGERLGYLAGGFRQLILSLEMHLLAKGCDIHTSTPARSLEREGEVWHVNGKPYDAVIATIPPAAIVALGGPAMPEIPYQGAACMTLALARDPAEGIYWLNLADHAPYGAVVTHTNFAPFDRYGSHIVYLASYFSGPFPEDGGRVMLEDFARRFSIAEEEILWHRLTVEPAAGPVYTIGYRDLIPPYEKGGLYCAGMYSRPNYPERSMEGSVVAGGEVAALVRERLA
ncbi:MAG: NAD(P)/FAD-dependent oxidoreductase [Methanomicrobiaceae archaeon]|nr:NAD(P)/FAD-dependent oxidoreductase [Methanomicrobiaceae archaeon]